MIQLLDYLENYKRNLANSVNTSNELVSNLASYGEACGLMMDASTHMGTTNLSEQSDLDNMTLLSECMGVMEHIANGITYSLPDGDGTLKVYTLTYYFPENNAINVIYDDGGIDELLWSIYLLDDTVWFETSNQPAGLEDLGHIVENISESAGIKNILIDAVSLAEKGELNMSNFMSTIPTYIDRGNANIVCVINSIKDSCSGSDPQGQATGLLKTIKTLFGNIPNATVSGNTISFNDTDFTVSTSLFGPISSVITQVGQVLTMALTLISPVIGALTLGLSSVVGQVVEYITDNTTQYFKFNNGQKDNDCFAFPIFQKKIPSNEVPDDVLDLIADTNMVKLINGLMTLYVWKEDGDNDVYFEGYLSADCDVRYNDSTSSLLLQNLDDFESVTVDLSGTHITGSVNTRNNIKDLLSHWLDNLATPGGNAQNFNSNIYGNDERQALACRRLLDGFRLLSYIVLALYYDGSAVSTSFITAQLDINFKRKNRNDVSLMLISYYFANDYLYNQTRPLSDLNEGYDTNVMHVYNSIEVVANMVNIGLPAVKRTFDSLSPTTFFTYFLKPMLPQYKDDDYDNLFNYGLGYSLYPSYIITNKGNCKVYPPQSLYPRWMQAIATSVAVIAVAVTTIVAVSAVKRRIQYKASQARNKIDGLYSKYQETGSYVDFSKAYRANKNYNRFWGKLSGTTYDLNNRWVDYTSRNSSSINSDATVTALLNKVSREISGHGLN